MSLRLYPRRNSGSTWEQPWCRHNPPEDQEDAVERRSEEHTSELQSRLHLVCRLLLEKKKKETHTHGNAAHAAIVHAVRVVIGAASDSSTVPTHSKPARDLSLCARVTRATDTTL